MCYMNIKGENFALLERATSCLFKLLGKIFGNLGMMEMIKFRWKISDDS